MNIPCPICSKILEISRDAQSYMDYICSQYDHSYCVRYKGERILKIKTRVRDNNTFYYLKINYDENCSEVWIDKDSQFTLRWDRIILDKVVDVDFSNLEKIKEKIQTYMLFS